MVRHIGTGRRKDTGRRIGTGGRIPAARVFDWDRYLERGEKLVWSGRPGQGLRRDARSVGLTLFGIPFLAFALFWTLSVAGGISPAHMDPFALFGLPFVLLGLYMVVGQWFFDAYKRKHTRYALTNRRMLVALLRGGAVRRMKSYPLTPETPVWTEEGAGHPSAVSVYFAKEYHVRKRGVDVTDIGFRYLPDGMQVYRNILQLQEAMT